MRAIQNVYFLFTRRCHTLCKWNCQLCKMKTVWTWLNRHLLWLWSVTFTGILRTWDLIRNLISKRNSLRNTWICNKSKKFFSLNFFTWNGGNFISCIETAWVCLRKYYCMNKTLFRWIKPMIRAFKRTINYFTRTALPFYWFSWIKYNHSSKWKQLR